MKYHLEELKIGSRMFDVHAEVVGDSWERPDRDVNLPGGFADFAIESIVIIEVNEDGEEVPTPVDDDTMKQIVAATEQRILDNTYFLGKLDEEHRDDCDDWLDPSGCRVGRHKNRANLQSEE